MIEVPCKTLFTIKEVSVREGSRVVVLVEYGLPGEVPIVVELKIGDSIEVGLIGNGAVKLEDLLDHEWSYHGKCPACGDVGPSKTDAPGCEYHTPECWLGKAIKESRKEVGDG